METILKNENGDLEKASKYNVYPEGLKKNDILDLSKLSPIPKKIGFGTLLLCSDEYYRHHFELDIIAVLTGADGKIRSFSDVVCYQNLRTNGIGFDREDRLYPYNEGEDDAVIIDLSKIDSDIEKITFFLSICDAEFRRLNFGMLRCSSIILVDLENEKRKLCDFSFELKNSTATAIACSELFRDGTGWKFKIIEEEKKADLIDIANEYV